MERVIFLIEDTHDRISCMLNPQEGERDGSGGLVIERMSGVARSTTAPEPGSNENPVSPRGVGETRMVLSLLFDVNLPGSSMMPKDVRELTRPLWRLTENTSGPGGERRVRRARFIWGKAWNVPVVVESLSERYEQFTQDGTPQRSWMKLALLRVSEEVPITPSVPVRLASIPSVETLAAKVDASWGVHEFIGSGTKGDSLWWLAFNKYGNAALWRLIARANDVINPLRIQAGALLKIPPVSVLGKKK
jgi:hypothetical protein